MQEKCRDRARDASTFRNAVETGGAGVRGGQSSGAAPSGHLVIDKKIKLDLNKARKYKPDKSVLHHCPYSERIRGFCEWLPGRDSHGCSLAYTQDVAVRVVLTWLWSMWSLSNPGKPIPYEFPLEKGALFLG